MKDRQKFSVRAFGNDGRRKKNEGDLVHSETAVEDFNGSGDSVADPVRLDLCVGIVYVSGLVLGLISMVVALLGVAVLITYSLQNGIILLVIAFLISPYGLPMAAIWLLGKVQDLKFIIQDLVYG